MKENQGKQQLKEKFELNQRKLNARIAEQQEEIKRLKRREEERKVSEAEEKTEHKRKLNSMRDTLEKSNKRMKTYISNCKMMYKTSQLIGPTRQL